MASADINQARAACALVMHDIEAEFGSRVIEVVVATPEEILAGLQDSSYEYPVSPSAAQRWALDGPGVIVSGPTGLIGLRSTAMIKDSGWELYVVFVAQAFQDAISESSDPRYGGLPFPSCPVRRYDSMEPDVVDDIASWTCGPGIVIPIGQLPPVSTGEGQPLMQHSSPICQAVTCRVS